MITKHHLITTSRYQVYTRTNVDLNNPIINAIKNLNSLPE